MKYLVVICLAAFLTGCGPYGSDQAQVNHVVLCWFKEPGNLEQRQTMIEVCHGFKDIPGVIDIRVGDSLKSDRDIVDTSFDVAVYLSYASEKDLRKYIVHPIHKAAVEKYIKPYVSKMLVYDFYSK